MIFFPGFLGAFWRLCKLGSLQEAPKNPPESPQEAPRSQGRKSVYEKIALLKKSALDSSNRDYGKEDRKFVKMNLFW